MGKIVKNIIALSVSSALSIGFIHNVNAATYQIIDKDRTSELKYTYAQKQNISGDMALSGTNLFNFPVQFESNSGEKYLDEDDFDEIERYASFSFEGVFELDDIEDIDALKAGTPTANDLAWVVRWLRFTKQSNIEYQKIGDTVALTNIGGVTEDYNVWDETFDTTTVLTRSTIDIISGITNGDSLDKISYGTATAPYLPRNIFTDSDNEDHVFWLRDHGNRGFYSYDHGTQIHQIVPLETGYIGGESGILDVNESGIAVGFSSYKVSQDYIDDIEDTSGGCADTDIVPDQMTLEACIARTQLLSSLPVYHTMAIKATLDPGGNPVVEQLGLLVEPHPDDERPHSSYALAVNSTGVAVGYASGWDDETETSPAEDERSLYDYAVVYKNSEVIDLTGDHSDKGSSRAYDINDAGIAVGHIAKVINGQAVQKFFYVDTTVAKAEIALVYPDDFFAGSDSTARAINNSGLIVGEGEVETHNESVQNPRRTAAFVYDMNSDVFSNLNDMIPCADRLNYDILEARGITDAGIITATAVIKVDLRDAKGELVLDENNTPIKEDVVRAISLAVMAEDGEVCSAEEEGKVVRKGAGFSFTALFALISLFGLRRKLKK